MTDQQLQLALAKMLPEKISVHDLTGVAFYNRVVFRWIDNSGEKQGNEILDTEWLHVCWLAEQALNTSSWLIFRDAILEPKVGRDVSASWQQRAEALRKVKGITI